MRDLYRILALPRRSDPPAGTEQLSSLLGGELRPIQAQALAEAWLFGGLIGPIAVGAGKTLITFLLPTLLRSERPVLLIPAKLREKTERDWQRYRDAGWAVAPVRIVTYEILGRTKAADLLDEIAPDLIMADEAHRLKNRHAACTRRLSRWMQKHPTTPFVALSGTLLSRSVRDCAHLFLWALRDLSPLPITYPGLEEWANVTDCAERDEWSPGPLACFGSNIEQIREQIRARIVSTPGVVASMADDACPASLRIAPWGIQLPRRLRAEIERLQSTWQTQTGEEIVSAAELWAHVRDMSQGFYYRWDPPAPRLWLDARRDWRRFVRSILSHSRSLDSEAHVAQAHPEEPTLLRWREARDSFAPHSVPVWLSDEVVKQAAAWARSTGGIVWCDKIAVGEALEALGLPYYGKQGLRQGQLIDDATGPLAASIAANKEGRNLQAWSEALVLAPPTMGQVWEQMLGRLHRQGQTADEVRFVVHLEGNNRESLDSAVRDAYYQQQILGKPPKLLLADWENS